MSVSCKGEKQTNIKKTKPENMTVIPGNASSVGAGTGYQLSTHILDLNKGEPAAGIFVSLYKMKGPDGLWEKIGENKTGTNGRVGDFLPISAGNIGNEGIYKLKFETKPYFDYQNLHSIYPFIEIVFEIKGDGYYHIPITMSANGYSTYKGN